MTETTFGGLASGQLCAGRYRIGAPLAQGGMGQLFHAVRLRDGRRVVLKCQSGTGTPDRAQLRAEAASLGSLAHSSIVRLVEFEESETECFLAMESLEGDDCHGRPGCCREQARVDGSRGDLETERNRERTLLT